MHIKSKCKFADHFVQTESGVWKCLAEERINRALASEEVREKTPCKVLQWSHGSNMATTSEQMCKLAHPISTIPTTTASAERIFSAFSRIKITFAPLSQDRMTQLSFLSIE
jgi:hypothetical protein